MKVANKVIHYAGRLVVFAAMSSVWYSVGFQSGVDYTKSNCNRVFLPELAQVNGKNTPIMIESEVCINRIGETA